MKKKSGELPSHSDEPQVKKLGFSMKRDHSEKDVSDDDDTVTVGSLPVALKMGKLPGPEKKAPIKMALGVQVFHGFD